MSNVSFKGNIGKVRPIEYSNDGQARIGFSVGENHSKFNKQTNNWDEIGTTWWNVTVFGKPAEALAEVLQEGAKQRVAVAGRAQTREYEHNGEKRTSLDVIADICGIIPNGQPQQQNTAQQSSQGWGGQQQTAPAADPWGAPAGNAGGWGNGTQSEVPF